jgi:hypothetical protein
METLTFFERTIVDNIDFEGYGMEDNLPLFDKVNQAYEIFKSEYGWNINRMGERRAFCEWLQGLPSSLTVPFYNSDILNRAYIHGLLDANSSEQQEDEFLNKYFMNLSDAFFTLKNNL